jgi:putative ABC transport system permease protein
MAVFTRILGGIRALARKTRAEAELDAELREYLDAAIDQKIAAGMNRTEAERAARAEMGSLEAVKDHVRDVGWESRVEAVWQDLRYAMRMVRRGPALAAVVVMTIAIGVGAATSMFSIMRNLLLAPPHVADPDRVFRLHQVFPKDDGTDDIFAGTSYPFYELLVGRATSLDAVAAYTGTELAVGTGPDARMARAAMVSAGFWRTLGPRPALGRFIEDDEAHPATGARVVVLGHAFWRGRFGGSDRVIGSTLRIKGQPYEIIGVAPRGFRGVELADVDLWLPMFAYGDGSDHPRWHTAATSFNVALVARLKEQAASAQASAELSTLYSTFLLEAYGPKTYNDPVRDAAFNERNRRARTVLGALGGGLGGDLQRLPEARITTWLVGIAFVLLAIACSNIAGLLLLRAVARRRELAMRFALGASRRRLALQLLTESSLLAVLGGVAAALAVIWAGAWLQRTILPSMAWEPTRVVEWSVISVAVLCVIAAALCAGMAPLWYVRADDTSAVRDGVLRGPQKRPRMLTGLLAVQGALTVVLLVGAGLFLRSLHNARTEDLGLDRDNVLAVNIDFSGTGRPVAEVAAFFERALERASAIPGITHASLAMNAPLRGARGGGSLRLPGRDGLPESPTGGPYHNKVTPGFLATTGMRLLKGRDLLESERNQGSAILVNETMANLYWPGKSPIGECVYRNRRKTCTTVVGVVADSRRFNLIENERYVYFYEAMPTNATDSRALLVRKNARATGVEANLRRMLLDLDSNLPFVDIATLGDAIEPQLRPWRLGASIFTAFGAVAVILAIVGLWSSVAYTVSQRTQEFAVRMTLGAHRTSLISLMLKEGVRDALIATTAGIGIALLASRYLTDLLYGVSPRDPIVFAAVAAGTLAVATLASLLPAWRISGIDPAAALRMD